jgi:hypothetical protein
MSQSPPIIVGAWRGANRVAPWIALILAGTAVLAMPQPPAVNSEVVSRHSRIEQALTTVPLRIGEWIGEERPLTPAAVELLRPNASLSRTYRRIGEAGNIAISLIHCSDFRDMAGHYPPVCYPAHGWSLRPDGSSRGESLAGEAQALFALRIDGIGEFPARCYRFSRLGDGLVEMKITVLNAFILPDGSWITDLARIREAGARRRMTGEGVAQLQLVLPGWPGIDLVREQCESLLSSMPSELFAIMGASTESTVNSAANGVER